jgi:putative flippase GtrA
MDAQESFATRMKYELWRVGSPFRFIVWSGVNALAGYLIYALLLLFLPYLVAYSFAYACGILLSYFLNSKLVFNRELKLSKALKYPLVYVVQYLVGTISLYVLVRFRGVNKFLAPAVVVLLTIPLTYFLSKRVVEGKTKQ